MGMHLGGPTSYKNFLHKRSGIVVALHWVNGEPAMALFPSQRRTGGAAFIICLSALHKYANKDGSPTPYLVAQAAKAAKMMALDEGVYMVRSVADAIMEHIEDVVKMPPMPAELKKSKGKPLGTISLHQGGKKVMEGELMDGPPAGATQH